MPDRPAPDLPPPIVAPDGAGFWAAAAEERLCVQRCLDCGELRFPPRLLCACGSDRAEWHEVAGTGTVYTFTIVHRAPDPAFRARTPYVIALVDLDEGPRMMTNILGGDALDVAIGDRVRVTFEDRGPDAKVPQFRREPAA